MPPGVAGSGLTVTVPDVLGVLMPQTFCAATDIVPDVLPTVAFIMFVVEVPLQVAGSVQTYEVAPGTAATLYDWAMPSQTSVLTVKVPGCAGTVLVVSASVDGELVHTPSDAITETLPEVVAALKLMVVEIAPCVFIVEPKPL